MNIGIKEDFIRATLVDNITNDIENYLLDAKSKGEKELLNTLKNTMNEYLYGKKEKEKIKMKVAKCLECQTELEIEETIDSAWEGSRYRDFVIGFCPVCGKVYEWEDIYTYESFTNLREYKE